MNLLCFLIATGFLWEVALSDTPTNSSKINTLLFDKCKQNSENAATYDNVKQYMQDFTDYLKVAFSHIPNGKTQFCEEDKNRLIRLSHILAREAKECFRKEEVYLPKFAYESFIQFLNFLCADNGKNIENIFSSLGTECMKNLKANNASVEVGHCFNKITPPPNRKIKKEELCQDLSIAKKCFATAVTMHCPDFPAFESLNKKFFKAIQQPCNAEVTLGISSVVLIITTLISIKGIF